MDYAVIKDYNQELRDYYLRSELGEEKCRILDKYQLKSNSRLYWERRKEHYPNQEYFSQRFVKKSSAVGIVFHIYRLCYAKTKYFDEHWEEYMACYYDFRKGYLETDIANMEFIKQRATGIVLDLRELARINRIEDFRALCAFLEEKRKEKLNVMSCL